MRKSIILLSLFALLAVSAGAQTKFGYLSYDKAIKSMPGYAVMKSNMAALRKQYENETRQSEEEFNRKYELFLSGQNELDKPILQKRQAELQELLSKSIAFKHEAERLLRRAEADMYAPLKHKLDSVLGVIGTQRGYAFILNTDNNALPFVNTAYGEDISGIVAEAIKEWADK